MNEVIVTGTAEVLPQHIEAIYQRTGEKVSVFPSIDRIPDAAAARAEILLTYGSNITHGERDTVDLSRFPNLRWIQMMSAGIENLPLKDIVDRGICVTNAAGVHVKPMSEYVLLCMLHFEKDMERYRELKLRKEFDRTRLVGELSGREVLIYGTGTIGKAVAGLLTMMGMNVYGVNTSGAPVEPFIRTFPLEAAAEAIGTADYVVSLLPDTAATRGLFSREYVRRMKPEAVFISLGRGKVVEENEIAAMIREGLLKGAAFDVFQQEPLPPDSPLWTCGNLLLTPHMSAKSIYYVDRCIDIFICNLLAYRNGSPMMNMIDPARQY